MTTETLLSLALGVSLAASAGLRAFLPLLVTGLAARHDIGVAELGPHFDWLESTPALVALGVATVVEVLGDKIPAVDHLLDALQTPVRTVAGMVAVAAVLPGELPLWSTALAAVVAGGGAAASVHAGKSVVRVGSTATTAGMGNPVLSVLEDIAALVIPVLSLIAIVFAVLFAVLALFLVLRVGAWLLRGRGAGDAPEAHVAS